MTPISARSGLSKLTPAGRNSGSITEHEQHRNQRYAAQSSIKIVHKAWMAGICDVAQGKQYPKWQGGGHADSGDDQV